jgi:hypothetical protein
MKAGVYWKKYNNVHIPEIKHFFLSLHNYLGNKGIDYDIIEQMPLHHNGTINRASHTSDLPNNLPVPTKANNVMANMPFKVDKKTGNYDIEFYFHTITECENVINIKPFYLSKYFYFDRNGYSGWSEMAKGYSVEPSGDFNRRFKYITNDYISNNNSKYKQPRNSRDELPEKFVFLAAQVTNDSVSNLARVPVYELIENASKILPKLGYDLVIKRHPRCNNNKVETLLKKLKEQKNIHIYNGSIHHAISNSKAVLAVNSGVGFESLLHDKPVITSGYSDYEAATYPIKESGELSIIDDVVSGHEKRITKNRSLVVGWLENNVVKLGDNKSFDLAFKRLGIL